MKTFKSTIQDLGMFIGSYNWQLFCTGTFRDRVSQQECLKRFRHFIRVIESGFSVGMLVAHIVVPENTTSGLGNPGGPWHCHFVMAVPDWHRDELKRLAELIWKDRFGRLHIEHYDRSKPGSFYLAKTSVLSNFEFEFDQLRLERMGRPKKDVSMQQRSDEFVPDHVKRTIRADTLRVCEA